MKKYLIISSLAILLSQFSYAQIDEWTAAKRAARQNLVIKEWNTDSRSRTKWLDRVTKYDSQGRKIEEIEYTQYGQKWRETYEYGENDKISKEVYYNDRNKPTYVRRYEYDSSNRKVKQYNYLPNGKLCTIKVFEYVTEDAQTVE